MGFSQRLKLASTLPCVANITDLFRCVLCSLGSHRLFSIGSSDQCLFIKLALWKTKQENWKQGNTMMEITIKIKDKTVSETLSCYSWCLLVPLDGTVVYCLSFTPWYFVQFLAVFFRQRVELGRGGKTARVGEAGYQNKFGNFFCWRLSSYLVI